MKHEPTPGRALSKPGDRNDPGETGTPVTDEWLAGELDWLNTDASGYNDDGCLCGYADALRELQLRRAADQPAPTETAPPHPVWCKCGDCKRTVAREIGVTETAPPPATTVDPIESGRLGKACVVTAPQPAPHATGCKCRTCWGFDDKPAKGVGKRSP